MVTGWEEHLGQRICAIKVTNLSYFYQEGEGECWLGELHLSFLFHVESCRVLSGLTTGPWNFVSLLTILCCWEQSSDDCGLRQ